MPSNARTVIAKTKMERTAARMFLVFIKNNLDVNVNKNTPHEFHEGCQIVLRIRI